MDSDSIAKINQAVDDALELCAGSATPYTVLREFLKELEDAGRFTTEELQVVEDAAKRVIASA